MDREQSNVWTSGAWRGRVSRRRLIGGSGVLGLGIAGAALVGCGGGTKATAPGDAPQAAGAAGGAGAAAGGAARPGVPVVKGAPKDGGTWTTAITSTDIEHDMHTAAAASIWHHISERAMQPNVWTNEIEPNLVEKWEIPDSTHFLLHVRKGVKLHDRAPWSGREFDAEDLAFNINRIPGNTAAAEGIPKVAFRRVDTLAGMSKVEAVDKYTVKVTMARPSSSFLSGLLDWRNVLMPKGVVEVGFKDPMKFAGFGPYMLTEFVPNVRQVYTRHPGYFRQGEGHFEKVVSTVVPDAAAEVAGFISKQFSMFSAGSRQDEQTVRAARPDALLYATPGIQSLYLRPNMKAPMFGDFRVRKALQLAINYQEIGEGYYGPGWGYTGPLFSGFADAWGVDKVKSLPGYNPDTKAKDIAEAQKMMAAAGFPNGDGLAFEIQGGPGTGIRAAQHENSLRFQAQMQKVLPGMKIVIRILGDQAAWAKAQTDKAFQMISFSSTAQGTATIDAATLYHSKGGRNYGNFVSAEADALLDKADVTLDLKERTAVLDTLQTKLMDEWMPMIMLHVETKREFLQPNVGGYDKLAGPFSQGMPFHRLGGLYNVS